MLIRVFKLVVLAFSLAACATIMPTPTSTPGPITITLVADGQTQTHTLSPELTVREALATLGLSLGELDRLSPPPYTRLTEGVTIVIVRVTEQFETEPQTIPFTSQTVKNEALPEGERRLLQAGANGLEELTYRTLFENGAQVSRSVVKRVTLTAPTPEIIMLGSQGSFTLVPISGTLVYVNGQNAWAMRKNSGQRLPLTMSGDLDGFIFELSPDSDWLLHSRAAPTTDAETFNTLWVISTISPSQSLSLPVKNALYAEWAPNQPRAILYSDATKIPRAPGWQANNNLFWLAWDTVVTKTKTLTSTAVVFTSTRLIDTSSGGPYGWWGTGFAVSPNGQTLAYARTDEIGLLPLLTESVSPTVGGVSPLTHFVPYNTHSDWAWYPALRWSPDGAFLYTLAHGAAIGLEAPEDSPAFDLLALGRTGQRFTLVPRAGMFANPVPSPLLSAENRVEQGFAVAYLQAADPNNSPFSTYRLGVMDRDGSNAHFIFPPADRPGLQANERFSWSPDGRWLAVMYEGNLWIVAPDTGIAQQLTGDGLSEQPRWGK
jgi:hypothetical protein